MCSHYTPVKNKSQLHDTFGVEAPVSMGKPDMWPGYEGVFIRSHSHADVGDEAVPAREAVLGHWGLIPHWSKDGKVKGTFNARSETVAEKPSFRDAWRKGLRCIVPAIAVYEPDWRSGKAVPTAVSRADGQPMGVAGIWSGWRGPNGWVDSFTMLTVNADRGGAGYSDRRIKDDSLALSGEYIAQYRRADYEKTSSQPYRSL